MRLNRNLGVYRQAVAMQLGTASEREYTRMDSVFQGPLGNRNGLFLVTRHRSGSNPHFNPARFALIRVHWR